MKNTIINVFFKVLCLAIISLTTLTLHAQWYDHFSQEEKEKKSIEVINTAEYMVEGRVLDKRCFYGDDGKTIYTDITLSVNHWYKRSGENSIHIVVKGGVVGADQQYREHSTGPIMHKNLNYFILLKSKSRDTYELLNENSVSSYGRYSRSWTDDFHIKVFYDLKFQSTEEFHTFISKINGVSVPRKKKDVGFQKSLDEITIDEISLGSVGNLHAGVGEILIIKGENFGTAGKVLFWNGDRPDTGHLGGLDNSYIDDWSDGEIRVIIPSVVSESSNHTAGSGTITIQRTTPSFEEKESMTQINIEYSILNNYYISTSDLLYYPVSPYLLGREHCLNGMVFTLHTSFEGNITAQNSVQTALTSWADVLGITLNLERKQGGGYYFHNTQSDPHRNIIYFDPTYVAEGGILHLMETTKRYKYDDCGGGANGCFPASVWRSGANIRIAVRNDWQYNPTGDTDFVGMNPVYDFYAQILHEIGHAIGLDHDVDLENGTRNLMSYNPPPDAGIALEEYRINLNQYSDRGKAGAQRVVMDSKAHLWTSDFFNRYGVSSLSNTNSTVQPTPSIVTSPSVFPNSGIQSWVKTTLKPSPLWWFYQYHWLQVETDNNGEIETTQSTATKRTGIPVCPQDNVKHYVRIKNASCSVSSLYSLPKVFPLPGCNGTGSGRDGSLIISPNPANNQIDITLESSEKSNVEDTYIGIYNTMGSLQKQQISDVGLRNTTINISELSAGTYWVIWFSGSGEVIATEQVQKIN